MTRNRWLVVYWGMGLAALLVWFYTADHTAWPWLNLIALAALQEAFFIWRNDPTMTYRFRHFRLAVRIGAGVFVGALLVHLYTHVLG